MFISNFCIQYGLDLGERFKMKKTSKKSMIINDNIFVFLNLAMTKMPTSSKNSLLCVIACPMNELSSD